MFDRLLVTSLIAGSLGCMTACGGSTPPTNEPTAIGTMTPDGVIVDPKDLKRIAGTTTIVPDENAREDLRAANPSVPGIQASFKVCIDPTGAVRKVVQLKSSGAPSYDDKIEHELHGWKFEPYQKDGAAAAACSAYTIVFNF